MSSDMKGMIFDIKEFGVHDGEGLVTTVFFKGCPLRCAWCHNPEGQSFEKELMVRQNGCTHCGLCTKGCNHPECQPFKRCIHICPENRISIAGEELESGELAQRILKNKAVIDGVSFSGGEPLAQPQFLLETISHLNGLKVNIETSGYCDSKVFSTILANVDFVFFDIKLADEQQHIRYTGQSNKIILKNLKILKTSGKPCLIRTPLIPGITDTKTNLDKIEKIIDGLPWQKLPYNEMAPVKYAMLNRHYDC